MSVGTTLAQAVAILISPILSRLFEPDAFGLAALFGSITMTIGLVGCLSYQLAILLPKDDETAADLLALCFTVMAAMTLVVAAVTAVAGETLLTLTGAADLAPYKWLIPAGTLTVTAALPFRYWASRHNRFTSIGAATAGASFMNAAATLGAGLLGWTSGVSLTVARLPGKAAAPAVLAWRFLRDDLTFCLRRWSASGMWQAAKRYKKFPLMTSWTQLLNMASRQAPVILIAGFFGPAAAGLYALGRRVITLPSTLIATSILEVFFQRGAAKQASGEDLSSLVRNVATRLITVGLLPMLIIGMAGPDLFGFVFGENWREAGLYAQYLVPFVFMMFVTSPLNSILMILERQGLHLLLNIGFAVVMIGSLVVGGLLIKEPLWTLSLFGAGGAIYKVLVLTVCLRMAQARMAPLATHLLQQLLWASPTIAIIATVQWGLDAAPVYVFVAAVIASVPYISVVLRRDAQLRSVLLRAVRKAGIGRRWNA